MNGTSYSLKKVIKIEIKLFSKILTHLQLIFQGKNKFYQTFIIYCLESHLLQKIYSKILNKSNVLKIYASHLVSRATQHLYYIKILRKI